MKGSGVRACRVATFLFCFAALAVASVAAPVPVPRQSGQPSLRATLKGHTTLVYSVAFSPDGKTLASGSMDGTIRLWDVKTGKQRSTLKGQGKAVNSVAYSLDGKTLASSSGKTILLWDMPNAKQGDKE